MAGREDRIKLLSCFDYIHPQCLDARSSRSIIINVGHIHAAINNDHLIPLLSVDDNKLSTIRYLDKCKSSRVFIRKLRVIIGDTILQDTGMLSAMLSSSLVYHDNQVNSINLC